MQILPQKLRVAFWSTGARNYYYASSEFLKIKEEKIKKIVSFLYVQVSSYRAKVLNILYVARYIYILLRSKVLIPDASHLIFGLLKVGMKKINMFNLTEFLNTFLTEILLLFLFSSRSQKEEALHFRVTKSSEVSHIEKVHSPEKQHIILSYYRYNEE